MIRSIAVAVVMLAACRRESLDDDTFRKASAALDQLEAVEAADRERVMELNASAETIRHQVQQVTSEWTKIAGELDTAIATYERAQIVGNEAIDELKIARQTYEQAADRFRMVAMIVIIAAASESLGGHICAQTTSTRTFRAHLRSEGRSLGGLDVDHVWPRALGGADHPLNYQLLDSSVNRGLGADAIAKFARWPLATLQGLAVSAVVALRCG
jgi:hypothetical protein